jgi:hypothetical protein
MNTRELIARELDSLPETELDRLLVFIRFLQRARVDSTIRATAAESALGKDWLTPEEDAA